LGSPVSIIYPFSSHGIIEGTQREATFRKSFWINHLLSYDDWDNFIILVDTLMDFLRVIYLIQDDVGKFEIRIPFNECIK